MKSDRRDFLKGVALTTGAIAVPAFLRSAVLAVERVTPYVACNQYAFCSFLGRDGLDAMKNFDQSLDIMKENGIDGIEPMGENPEQVKFFGEKLKAHDMGLHTIYSGVNLHDQATADAEINRILSVGGAAKDFGTKVIVVNAAPKSGKTDEELVRQSHNFNTLGSQLKKQHGIALAYHYHTTELEFGAREFHHAFCGTDPENLTLCFEMQWSYRASGNSAIAVFDHLKLYGDRVSMIHLRQSQDDIWTETFGDGDIDCHRLSEGFNKLGIKPHLVLEQAAENGTPNTMKSPEVFQESVDYIRKVFA